jgi:hypothetical protein
MSRIHKVVAHLAATHHAFHKSMVENPDDAEAHHKTAMEACAKDMADCEKAAIADTLEKVRERDNAVVEIPGLSRVAPNAPGVVAVPRAGQPAVPSRPNVPLAFQKLVQTPDEEENMQQIG